MAYGSIYDKVGVSAKPKVLSKASRNWQTRYFKATHASGDIRIDYTKLSFTGVGGGEVIRAIGAANGLLCATGATINAAHFTGRVEAAKTVSGALNAVRATLEVAGTTPTPGGTLSALQLDTNISTGWTAGDNDAFIRVGNTGAGLVGNLLNIEVAPSSNSATALISTSANAPALSDLTHYVKCRFNGTSYWLVATAHAPHS